MTQHPHAVLFVLATLLIGCTNGASDTAAATPTPTTEPGTETVTETGFTKTTSNPTVGDVNGRTYRFNSGALVISEPTGAGPLMGGDLFQGPELMVQVLNQTGTASTVRISLQDPDNWGSQSLCDATTDMIVDWDDPAFNSVAEGNLSIGDYLLQGVIVDGVVYEGGTRLEAHLVGELAMSALDELVGGDACALLASFDVFCSTCTASDGACLKWEVDGVAEELADLDLIERTQQMIDADPDC